MQEGCARGKENGFLSNGPGSWSRHVKVLDWCFGLKPGKLQSEVLIRFLTYEKTVFIKSTSTLLSFGSLNPNNKNV